MLIIIIICCNLFSHDNYIILIFSEVWLVPRKTGGYIPATLCDPKAEVVRALNWATSGQVTQGLPF